MKTALKRWLLVAAWTPLGCVGLAHATGGSISIAVAERPQQLDPMRTANAPDILVLGQIYGRLLHRNSAGVLSPGLAEKWSVSGDGKTYVFTLRDAKFSNGTPITASDVVFSLDRVLHDKESAYPAPLEAMESITATNAKTVTIKLKAPNAPFLENLEVFNAAIVSKADVKARGEQAAFANPVSSGPFVVKNWEKNAKLTLVRNPNYYRTGFPKLDSVNYQMVEDDNTRISMLKAGAVDVIEAVPYVNIAELRGAGFSIPLERSTKTRILLVNHDRPPFNDVRVRQAAMMALDRAQIARAVTQGLVTKVANSTLPGALKYHWQDDKMLGYNISAAKALLAKAGAVGANVTILQTAGSTEDQQVALLAQAMWSKIGLSVKIEQLDSAALRARRKTERTWSATPSWYYNETLDPDLAVRWAICNSCGSNSFFTAYKNAEVDRLTDEALVETDARKRAALYQKIQKTSTEEVAHIPLFYPPFTNAYSKKVKGLFMTPALQWTLEEAVRN